MTEGGLGSSPWAGELPITLGRRGSVVTTCAQGTSGGSEPGLRRFCMVDVFHGSSAVLHG